MFEVGSDGKEVEKELSIEDLKVIARKNGVKPGDLQHIFCPPIGKTFEIDGNKFKVTYVRGDLKFSAKFIGFNSDFKKEILSNAKEKK